MMKLVVSILIFSATGGPPEPKVREVPHLTEEACLKLEHKTRTEMSEFGRRYVVHSTARCLAEAVSVPLPSPRLAAAPPRVSKDPYPPVLERLPEAGPGQVIPEPEVMPPPALIAPAPIYSSISPAPRPLIAGAPTPDGRPVVYGAPTPAGDVAYQLLPGHLPAPPWLRKAYPEGIPVYEGR